MSPEADVLPVTDEAIAAAIGSYEREGYAELGPVAPPAVLEGLRARADALMDGDIVYEGMFFQRDAESGDYHELPYGRGFEGPTRNYRKIEKLELDPVFTQWMKNSVFQRIAQRVLGNDVFLLRAMMMTKPARGGTPLPWHQDGGRFWGVDPTPRLQLWTALDDAPFASGCVEVVPGTHHAGLATLQGGVVPAKFLAEANAEARARPLPAKAGDVLLIHNMMWHRSGVNATDAPRRAFSVCFVDANTRCTRTRKAPRQFMRVFG